VGNFYTSVTVRGPHQEEVFAAMRALSYQAFVTDTVSGLTVICEQQSDTQDQTIWHDVAKQVSRQLNCAALAVMNHDDDILMYALYGSGKLLDDYNSCPDYCQEEDTPAPPSKSDADALCESFGMPGNQLEVERVLRADDEQFVFAYERHAALVKALDWPAIPYQQGFDYLMKDGSPSGWRVIRRQS
jgi:hypothetical protein